MKVTVIGIRHIEYDNKQGRHIEGTRLYVTYDDARTSGLAALDVFLPISVEPPNIGDDIILMYNRYGRCTGFDFAG